MAWGGGAVPASGSAGASGLLCVLCSTGFRKSEVARTTSDARRPFAMAQYSWHSARIYLACALLEAGASSDAAWLESRRALRELLDMGVGRRCYLGQSSGLAPGG